MDWPEYQQLCDRPDVWTRWMLEQTRALLREAGDLAAAALLDAALAQAPLSKPVGHRGPAATDVFRLALTRAQVARVCEVVEAAVADRARVPTTGVVNAAVAAEDGLLTTGVVNATVADSERGPTTGTRGLGGFREAWQEYLRHTAG